MITKTLSVLLCLAATSHGATILTATGTDADYQGPDAPSGGPWDYSLTASFDVLHESGSLLFRMPQDESLVDINSTVTWDGIDENARKFFSDDTGELQLVLHTDGNWNDGLPLTQDNFEARVSRVELNYWEPKFNPGGNFQTVLKAQPDTYTVPEPAAIVLLVAGVVLGGACRLRRSLCVLAAMLLVACPALADGGHGTRPEIHTPIGFSEWRHTDELDQAIKDGPTVHVRDDGSMKMYAQQDTSRGGTMTWFHRNLAWRWKDSDNGPFGTNCLYVLDGPNCSEDFYMIEGGKRLLHPDGSFKQNQEYINYVQERAEYLPPSIAQDTDVLMANMWFTWDSAYMDRTPQGLRIFESDETLGADSLILVSNNPPSAIPEPSSLALCVAGLAFFVGIRRRACRQIRRC